jgi:predicted DNA-binding WGR domain protein
MTRMAIATRIAVSFDRAGAQGQTQITRFDRLA